MSEETLHVYSQYGSHDDAVIVGTKDALIKLRHAIDNAIEVGNGQCSSFTADGEGFTTVVMHRESKHYYQNVGLPYASDAFGQGGPLDPRDPEADNE